MNKPEEGPREGSHVYLKQSVGQPLERKLLTNEQLKELHEKLQLVEHTVGWGPELKTELHELLKEYSFSSQWTVWIWERQISSNIISN